MDHLSSREAVPDSIASNREDPEDVSLASALLEDVKELIEEKIRPETTEIWRYLVKEEVAKALDQPLPEIEQLVCRVIAEFGITSTTSLSSIPEHVFLRQGIPAAFCHLLRQGVPTNDNATEVEIFMWKHGFDDGLNSREIRHLIECIVEKHWLETWDDLRMLPSSQWSRLGIQDGNLIHKMQAMIDKYETAQAEKEIPSSSMYHLLKSIGERLGKDPSTMASIAERIKREYGIQSAEELLKLPDDIFITLPLPMKLLAELIKLRPSGLKPSTETAASPLMVEREGGVHQMMTLTSSTYVEPDSSTFLMRVGRHYGHTFEEVKTVIDVLVKQHWLKTLTKLRELNDRDWEELFLSRKFVNEIRGSLVDPTLLGMTAVWQEEPPCDLFPLPVEKAISDMYDELALEDRPVLIRSFLRLLEILIVVPLDASKRSIRKANPNYASRAAQYPSVPVFFLSLGYVDFGSHFLLPILYKTKVEAAHSKLASYACHLSDFPTIQKGGRSPPGSPLRGLLTSSQSLWEATGEWFKAPDGALNSLFARKRTS